MTTRGKIVLTILVLAIAGFGGWKWWSKLSADFKSQPPANAAVTNQAPPGPGANSALEPDLVDTQFEGPQLAPPGVYLPQDNTVLVELSEYAGYAGLMVANNGLEPTTNSVFFQKHGFKVKLTLSEEESWSALNSGKMAASATTADVLAIYGKSFQVVVPAQIGFSRGADGVVVRSDLKRINDLKGKTLATAQFTEADFFIRYLAQEAGLGINMLSSLKTTPDPDKLNLVFCKDAFAAGDVFLRDIKSGANRLAGCVTWAPETTEIAKQSEGKAHILTTSRNLLIIADVLVVNKGFSQQHPEMVAGLVDGLLTGNRRVREQPDACAEIIARAFKWDRPQVQAELDKVHLSNLPENQAFFSGAIAAAGSFGSIYQSAVFAYGNTLIKEPADGDRFLDLKHLKALEQSGAYKDQQVAIAPMRGSNLDALEGNPLLSKNIRFLFAPNSATLETNDVNNLKNLEVIKNLLQISPGSAVLLRGHVDNSKVEDFRKAGGEPYVRTMALRAIELSKNRAAEIKRILMEKFGLDAARIDVLGRGWEEPLGTDAEQNRRVEVQWFMLE